MRSSRFSRVACAPATGPTTRSISSRVFLSFCVILSTTVCWPFSGSRSKVVSRTTARKKRGSGESGADNTLMRWMDDCSESLGMSCTSCISCAQVCWYSRRYSMRTSRTSLPCTASPICVFTLCAGRPSTQPSSSLTSVTTLLTDLSNKSQ
ncbi:hypothetical protein SDC9_132094 [bioreactor metagenome]|uniref:Uncharacterized protein n=1 Tax=bioreactor metagenome TaxID=1076179 RepID=A0A645D758_9ZZZZ